MPFAKSRTTPCPDPAIWQRLLNGSLDANQQAELLTHLENCEPCLELSGSQTGRWRLVADVVQRSTTGLSLNVVASLGSLAQARVIQKSNFAGESIKSAGLVGLEPPQIPGLTDLVEVGQGGMGVVYRALEVELGRSVAVKVLTAAGQLSPKVRVRAQQEAATLARLRHPNVVQIFRSGEVAGLPYLVMEWIAGGNLQQQIDRCLPSPSQAAQIIRDLASAVSESHAIGVIHRDLKPANVLLTDASEKEHRFLPKLADFGLARPDKTDHGLTESGVVVGTPEYMAPEQTGLSSGLGPVGPATDIHGLGAILYGLLSGHAPYEGSTKWESLLLAADGRHRLLDTWHKKIPRDLVTIVEKCLQTAPQRRYRAAAELVDELDRFLAGKPIFARSISTPERLWKWARRRPVAAVSGVLLSLATVSGIAGTAYHIRSMSQAITELSESREKTRAALELANSHSQQFQRSLATFDDELIQRLVDRGSALNVSDRVFLQKVRDLYQNAPLEPDPLTAYKDRAARLDRLGKIFFQINQYEDARVCQRAAMEAYSQALMLDANDLGLQKAWATSLVSLHNSLMRMNRFDEAEPVVRYMVKLYRDLARQEPAQRIYEASSLVKLGATLDGQKRFQESKRPMSQALQILDEVRQDFAGNEQFWLIQLQSLFNAALSSRDAGRYDECEARLGTMLELSEIPTQRFPENAMTFVRLQALALTCRIELCLEQHRLIDADSSARRLMQLSRPLLQVRPQDAQSRDSFYNAIGTYYEVCKALGKPQEAEADLLVAVQLATEGQKAEPAIYDRSRALLFLLEQNADLYQRTDRLAEALIETERLLECARPWVPIEGYAAEVRGNIRDALQRQIAIYSGLGNHAEATRLLEQLLAESEPGDQPRVQALLQIQQMAAGAGSEVD